MSDLLTGMGAAVVGCCSMRRIIGPRTTTKCGGGRHRGGRRSGMSRSPYHHGLPTRLLIIFMLYASWTMMSSSNHWAVEAFSVAVVPHKGWGRGIVVLLPSRRRRRQNALFRWLPLSASPSSTSTTGGEPGRRTHHHDHGEEGGCGADPSARNDRILVPWRSATAAILASTEAANNGGPSPAHAGGLWSGGSFESSVSRYFPGSITNSELASRVILTLTKLRGYDPNVGNTLLGASLCPDELNDTPTSLFSLLRSGLTKRYSGGVFNLGGLGGVPFVGRSGFDAFFGHCPENGKVLIVYGPHVGISSDGTVGMVERVGMDGTNSGACGAALGAYKEIMSEKAKADSSAAAAGAEESSSFSPAAAGGSRSLPLLPYTDPDAGDVQEDYIIRELRRRLEEGGSRGLDLTRTGDDENSLIALVTNRMYDVVSDLLRREVGARIGSEGFFDDGRVSEVTLLGGIVINRGNVGGYRSVEDRFMPVTFESFTKPRTSVINTDLFGHLYDHPKIYVDVPSAVAIGGAATSATIGGVVSLGRQQDVELEVQVEGRSGGKPVTIARPLPAQETATVNPSAPTTPALNGCEEAAETTPPEAAVEESPKPRPPTVSEPVLPGSHPTVGRRRYRPGGRDVVVVFRGRRRLPRSWTDFDSSRRLWRSSGGETTNADGGGPQPPTNGQRDEVSSNLMDEPDRRAAED